MIHRIALVNFKGTTAYIDLKQLNIFRGTSGSGKSTWLEAVRVAVLGHDPGYGKLLAETMAFASDSVMSVSVFDSKVAVNRIFEDKDGKLSQTILINEIKMTKVLAEQEIAKSFGQFPMMLNPDEFFEMSDDKKITFLFGLSNTETDSAVIRRDCIIRILGKYTDAVPLIMEYELKTEDYHSLSDNVFERLGNLVLEKIAKKDVEAGRALTKIFSEFLSGTFSNGQQALSTYVNVLKEEINATRRAKSAAEAANRKLMEEKTDKLKLVSYNAVENQEEVEKLRKEISEIEKELHARDKIRSAKAMLTSGLNQHHASVVALGKNLAKLEAGLLSKAEKEETFGLSYGYEIENHRLSEKVFMSEVRRISLDMRLEELKVSSEVTQLCVKCGRGIRCEKCGETEAGDLARDLEDLKETKTKLKEVNSHLEAVHAELEENEEDGMKISSILVLEIQTQDSVDIARKHLEDVTKLVKSQKANLDKMEEPGAGDDMLKAQLSGLKVTLGERLVAAKNHEWLRTLSATIARANETISNSTALLTALSISIAEVKVVRDELTASATSSIEKVANGLLETVDEKFGLMYDINDGKFEVRCVNVSGKVVPFKTLSGGEKVLYLSAQLLALMTIVDPKLKILEVEMGELSGNLVPPFMDALEAMTKDRDIQVVLSSCHRDFEVPGDSWAIHEMG